ncbi:hypothetical protein [Plastoroseomonas arctica]|uniref:Uncharacterized protein n=1 Tax=Plastoroseomonas arctica TaxID=1509237 RepID=A0AAF1KLF2_9PROT|nr:hypothetical protein [Plastoroseomonas arctica]MBR0654671.1 hypothetical protein [Plastoroseomonas arctica]
MQPSPLKAVLAAVILMTAAGQGWAQPAPAATPEFTIERRDALRRTWQRDPAIRDYVGPGDADRLDAHSDFYSEDYTGRQSLAPAPTALDVAIATVPETAP